MGHLILQNYSVIFVTHVIIDIIYMSALYTSLVVFGVGMCNFVGTIQLKAKLQYNLTKLCEGDTEKEDIILTRSIRVLIADDHAIVRSGVKMLLAKQDDIEVVGEASDGREAVEIALLSKPDVVIMDLSMPPGKNGLDATIELRNQAPSINVLILTMHDEEEYLFRVLQVGASGYILKNALDSELVAAVRAVSAGQVYLYPTAAKTLVEDLLNRINSGENVSNYQLLSDREREIVILIAKGFTNKEISEKLFISVKTVETHKRNIMEKLDLQKRHEIVEYALKRGLLSLDTN